MDTAGAVAALAANPASFVELVAQLQDADNDRRKAAEAVFDLLKERPDLCITCLVQTLRTCSNMEARLFCSVMIRKVIYYRGADVKAPVLWNNCSPAVQVGTKQALLEALVQEPDRNVSGKVCAAVSDLATLIGEEQSWAELMPTLHTMLRSGQLTQVANALRVLAEVAGVLADHIKPQMPDFVAMLVGFLGSGNKEVTVAAADVATSFIEVYEDAAVRQVLSPLVQPMLAVLGQLLNSGDEEEARSVLEMFIELAGSSARFLRPHLIPLVDAMMHVARAGETLDAQTRQMAVEFLVSLCEAREQSPGMMRKVPNLARSLFELVMGFLLDIEAWLAAVSSPLFWNSRLPDASTRATMDTAGAVAALAANPASFVELVAQLQDADNDRRKAAEAVFDLLKERPDLCITCLVQTLRTCSNMEARLFCSVMIRKVIYYRGADVKAPVLWNNCSPAVQVGTKQALLEALVQEPDRNVSGKVCAAVSDLATLIGEEQSWAELMPTLHTMLRSGQLTQVANALRVLAEVAGVLADHIKPQMPVMSSASYLEQLARMCVMGLGDAEPHVRWAACQALGQMCTDLGPDLQAKHHAAILPALMRIMEDFASPRVQAHACAAIVNFSEGVETEVLPPYLDSLILKLLNLLQHGARLVQEGALTALASVADSSQAAAVDVAAWRLSMQLFVACVGRFGLRELFNKYYDTVMPLLMHILTSANLKEHRLMRAKALECISLVGMAVGRDKFRADARSVLGYMQGVQAAGMEADDPLASYMLQADKRRAERASRRSTEDFDAEEAEALEAENEMEEELFDQVATAVGAFLKKFGDDVLPLVESLLMTRYGAMLTDKTRGPEERRIAICLVDDMVENSPAGMAKHFANVYPLLLDATRSDHADLRQCAVYGLGVMAAKAPVEAFRPTAASVAEVLAAIVNHPESKSDDNDMATDNAVSALGRILAHHAEALGPDGGAAYAALWLGSFPLKADAVEATAMHEQLVQMCEAQDPRVVPHAAKVASVFAEVLGGGKTYVAGPVGLRMAQLLHRLQPAVPAEALSSVLSAFSPKQQASYQAYMSGSVPA
ncbi:Importin-5 [Tetrabaena socialis]|uniref:Importin-5 n=1 Tax=Tetrabaena socialis TaxID=47790 RepID=A0A2J8AAP0_9CHLO|nr:Importin-5 [Tetrabaena socialis]|eukprot:PNH09582.1 Importin-5 [Tetrabaena socialis]